LFLVENVDEVYQSTISEEKVGRNAIKFQNAPTTFHSEGQDVSKIDRVMVIFALPAKKISFTIHR
jgi:hypothetical protein